MRRFIVALAIGACSAAALFIQACGGGDDSNTNDGGGNDGTVGQDTGQQGMDSGGGMDTGGGMDSGGMDGSMGTDGGSGMSNPGIVNCGPTANSMPECDAGNAGCCVRLQQDGGLNYSCQPAQMCQGIRWTCDERADCPMGVCCIFVANQVVDKTCAMGCGNQGARACKSTNDCPDAGACNTYTCPGSIQVQACSKPQGCM